MGTPKPPVSTLKPRRTAASTDSGLCAVIQRRMKRHHDDRRAHPEPRRLRRDVGRELGRPREIAVGREVVLGEPYAAEAERLGRLSDLEPARVDLLRGARRRRLHQQERSEVHGRSFPSTTRFRYRFRTRYQGWGWPGTFIRNV